MALLGFDLGILEGGTIVQHRQVVEEHRVTGAGDELERKALVYRNLIDQVKCANLLRTERRLRAQGTVNGVQRADS